jgi:hypothetical protein
MTPITALIRAWLMSQPAVTAVVADRIAPVADTSGPSVVIGPVSGGPQSTASATVDAVETWNVALYCHTPRGRADQPPSSAAWTLARTVVDAAAALDRSPFTAGDGTRIVRARVVTAVPTTDPDTGDARATVTLAVTVWR